MGYMYVRTPVVISYEPREQVLAGILRVVSGNIIQNFARWAQVIPPEVPVPRSDGHHCCRQNVFIGVHSVVGPENGSSRMLRLHKVTSYPWLYASLEPKNMLVGQTFRVSLSMQRSARCRLLTILY